MITLIAVANAVMTYGPSVLPLVQKLVADIEAGKGNQSVSSADIAELIKLSQQTGEDIFAREGVTPPPKSP